VPAAQAALPSVSGVQGPNEYFLVRLEDGGNLLEMQALEAMAGGITELDGVVFETPIVALQRDNVVNLL